MRSVWLALILSCSAAAADASERAHERLNSAVRAGEILPLPSVEARILPMMEGHRYLGPEIDLEGRIYRLKFLKDRRVIWIDVDARTGRVIGRLGG